MKQRLTNAITCVALLLGLVVVVAAQTREDFTGSWKLNADKSKFASSKAPEKVTIRFESDGKVLILQWRDQGGTYTRRFVFDENRKSLTMQTRDTDPSIRTGDIIVLEK